MVPTTFPSSIDSSGRIAMKVYRISSPNTALRYKTDVGGYVPIKAVTSPVNYNSYGNSDAIVIEEITDITGLVAWQDYIPVADDGSGTVPFSTNTNGYIPTINTFGFFANGQNLFFNQNNYDAYSAGKKTLVSTTTLQSLGIVNNVATTNPPGSVVLRDGTLGYGAHNLLKWSQGFDNPSWVKAGCSLSNGASTPDGTVSSRLTVNAGSVQYPMYGTDLGTSLIGPFTTAGFVVKYVNTQWLWIRSDDAGAGGGTAASTMWAAFDIQNGVVGGKLGNVVSSGMVALGDGWYFCWLSCQRTSTATSNNMVIRPGNSTTPSNAATTYAGTEAVDVWRAQWNLGPVPVDYVPTTTAAVYAPRLTFTTAGALAGLLREVGRTRETLQPRDMTQAAWTKSASMTAAKTQTGQDGVANSASSLTAAAINQTCLQVVTSASAARAFSAGIKSLAGGLTIDMTCDGGATWQAVTITTSWARYPITQAAVTNPSYGFRLRGSGDSIAVDFVQGEQGTFATSPIWGNEAAAVTRSDDLIRPPTSYINDVAQTTCVEFVPAIATPGAAQLLIGRVGSGYAAYLHSAAGAASMYDGTNLVQTGVVTAATTSRIASRYSGSTMALSLNGAALVSGAFDGTMGTSAGTVYIGDDNGGAGYTGLITRLGISTTIATDSQLQAISAGTL